MGIMRTLQSTLGDSLVPSLSLFSFSVTAVSQTGNIG